MTKRSLLLVAAAAASIAGLTSCDPPQPPPPPLFTPNPPFAPVPVPPAGTGADFDVSPPPTPQPPPPVTTPPGTYPLAKPTDNPDQVISPYEPYNVIDISGPPRLTSGQLARDPSNKKIFRVP
jgi:hypothetical protein